LNGTWTFDPASLTVDVGHIFTGVVATEDGRNLTLVTYITAKVGW
jgi:hypothetical protein